MSLLDALTTSLPSIHAIRAAANVVEVDEGHGFCASVLVTPGETSVARLDRSLDGAPYEGAVLRWVMLHTTGLYGSGYFVYRLRGRTLPSLTILCDEECSMWADAE